MATRVTATRVTATRATATGLRMRLILGPSRRGRRSATGPLVALLACVTVTTGMALAAGAAHAPAAGAAPGTDSPSTTTPTTKPPVTTTATAAAPATVPTTAAPTTTTTTAATAGSGAEATKRITPIIECTYVDPDTKLSSTVWGYQNLGPVVQVPIGDLNHFNNPPGDAGQPTEFKAGRNQNVFVVTARGESTWVLTGNETTTPGAACKTNPVPIVSTGLGGLVSLAVVTGVMGFVLFWRMRRPRRS